MISLDTSITVFFFLKSEKKNIIPTGTRDTIGTALQEKKVQYVSKRLKGIKPINPTATIQHNPSKSENNFLSKYIKFSIPSHL